MLLFISGGEIIFILFIAVMIFGVKSLPEIAKTLGKGVKQFKDAANEIKKEISKEDSQLKDDLGNIKKTAEDINKNVKKYKIFEDDKPE